MKNAIKLFFGISDFKRKLLSVIFICFAISFLAARAYSTIIRGSIEYAGFHIHHFYFGALLLCLGGILGTLSSSKKSLIIASGLIGIGMGLFADEIGLLLNCTSENQVCSYYFPDSFDIVGTIAVAIILLYMFIDPFQEIMAKRNGKRELQK